MPYNIVLDSFLVSEAYQPPPTPSRERDEADANETISNTLACSHGFSGKYADPRPLPRLPPESVGSMFQNN